MIVESNLSLLAILLATWISEDVTCISVGFLIAAGQLSLGLGIGACFLGILLGDLGVWYIGRTVRNHSWVRQRLRQDRYGQITKWLDRHGSKAVLLARFLPGTRVPFFFTVGVLGQATTPLLLWAILATAIWTPLVILLASGLGISLLGWISSVGWGVLAFCLGWFLLIRLSKSLTSEIGRAKWLVRWQRLYRWEFWPAWIFYLPLIPWLAWLSLRHRSVMVWSAANPGIPGGGIVGESKYAILRQLPKDAIQPSLLVPSDSHPERFKQIRDQMEQQGWSYPLILKPDAGQRGVGVKKIHDLVELQKYLQANPEPILAQPYHPGPYEVGIFYYRIPGEAKGRIFSITDKQFPILQGDGVSTLEQLIWKHPRYAMQAEMFLKRHEFQQQRVLSDQEWLPLGIAGNHSQGTLFCDGSHFWSEALEDRIDQIAQAFPGFYFGRFDIRYPDRQALQQGNNLAILELNGVTSESTNLYDPTWSLWQSYNTLFRQWTILYRIGGKNRSLGHRPLGVLELVRLLWNYYHHRQVNCLAD